jgi:hypothetical protein
MLTNLTGSDVEVQTAGEILLEIVSEVELLTTLSSLTMEIHGSVDPAVLPMKLEVARAVHTVATACMEMMTAPSMREGR